MATDPNWSAAEPLPFIDGAGQHVAVAAAGQTLHLVWSTAGTLYHARRTAGDWEAPRRIAGGLEPALAASSDGSLICAYANSFLGNREIYCTSWDGTKWALPQTVSHTTGESFDPAVCVGTDDIVHIAWADSTPGYSTIYYATRRAGAWINAPIRNGKGCRPAIAVDGDEVFVAWQARLATSDTGSYDVLVTTRRENQWDLPDLVSATPESHSIVPQLATNADNRCHLVWQEERAGLYVVRHSDRWPNGWSEPVDVSDPLVDARLAYALPNRYGLFQFVWSEGSLIKHRTRPGEPQGIWWPTEIACEAAEGLSELATTISPVTGVLSVVFGRHEDGDAQHFYLTWRKAIERKRARLPAAARH